MPKTKLPASDFLTIQEAADLLKVSSKTLRRWEEKGSLVPLRTEGKHRRYSYESIIEFKKEKKHKAHVPKVVVNKPTQAVPFVEKRTFTYTPVIEQAPVVMNVKEEEAQTNLHEPIYILEPAKKTRETSNNPSKYAMRFLSVALLLAGLAISAKAFGQAYTGISSEVAEKQRSEALLGLEETGKVLADTSVLENLKFILNIPAELNEGLKVTGDASISGTLAVINNLSVGGDDNTIAGTLTLTGNNLASTGDLVIDPGGGGR